MNQQIYYLISYAVVLGCITAAVLTNHLTADALVGVTGIILGHIGGLYTPSPLTQAVEPKTISS